MHRFARVVFSHSPSHVNPAIFPGLGHYAVLDFKDFSVSECPIDFGFPSLEIIRPNHRLDILVGKRGVCFDAEICFAQRRAGHLSAAKVDSPNAEPTGLEYEIQVLRRIVEVGWNLVVRHLFEKLKLK
jgi:hypothetical protein